MQLKEGDDLEIPVLGERPFDVERDRRERALERIRLQLGVSSQLGI